MRNFKEGKVRLTALFLAAVMLFGTLPPSIVSAAPPSGSGRTYTVIVQDESGNPITGATVTASNGRTEFSETDTSGEYSYTSSSNRNQTYNVTVSCEGYESQTVSVSRNNTPVTVTLRSNGPKYSVSVTVLDMNTKQPIEGAAVEVGSTSATAAGGGVYTFAAADGTYTVTVTADGYEEGSASITVDGADAAATVYLDIARYVATVNVVNGSADDAGIHGATVVYTNADGSVTGTASPYSSLASDVGTYTFTAPAGEYTLSVSAEGFTSGTGSVDLSGQDDSTTVTLEQEDPDAEYVTFEMFYYIGSETNTFPTNGYAASGDPSGYGPSGDDTPFALFTVNITELKKMDSVSFSGGTSTWNFVPLEEGSMDAAKAFWEDVLACATEASRNEIRATGLYDEFVCYCLKQQSSDDWHADGVLAENPPVFVVELHKDGAYVGGTVTGEDGEFPTMQDQLDALEGYLGHNIVWDTDDSGNLLVTNGSYTGRYVEGHYLYGITVSQMNETGSNGEKKADITYQKVGEYYYLAQFAITTAVQKEYVEYTVTYTDGVTDETVFSDQVYGVFENEAGAVPAFTGSADRPGFVYGGWLLEGGDGTVLSDADIARMTVTGDMVFTAVYEAAVQVTFYANIDADEAPLRTYYSPTVTLPAGQSNFALNDDHTVPVFYDLPQFDYAAHNGYIFKGWYLDQDNENDASPMDWTAAYTESTEIYAHWIYVGTVDQEDDGKQNISNGAYSEYDLAGTQIRLNTVDSQEHYMDGELVESGSGNSYEGLRYMSVISERVWSRIKSIRPENVDGAGYDAEYGMVLARKTRAAEAAGDDTGYQLQYNGSNVNGVDTSSDYWYAVNFKCSGLKKDGTDHDHFNGADYRLYTLVLTYTGYADDAAREEALETPFIARAYIRYYDANGLYRTHYNNYAEDTNVYHGCSASYDQVVELTEAAQ